MNVLAGKDRLSGSEDSVGISEPDAVQLPPPGIAMRRVALIYNPASGQRSRLRTAVIEDVLAVLRGAGIEAEALETYAPGSAGTQAQEAVRRGCDTILACGGDGTVHEILQCLVGTPVALGVVPLGTANALAANLGLGSSPAKAIRMLLTSTPVRVSVGHIFYRDAQGASRSRYFTVAAGVGADALFMSRLDPHLKRRFGYALYLAVALRVWATHSFPLFNAAFVAHDSHSAREEAVSQLLAVRIRDFGGILHNLVPGATLRHNRLRLVAFKTRSRLHYLGFIFAILFRRNGFSQKIELLDATAVECRVPDGSSASVFVEADGELLGALPVRIEIVPESLTLLIPSHARP
ncbi:MAG TPA: diacylglycerol kinase family protein [Terracidiphilus sp.]